MDFNDVSSAKEAQKIIIIPAISGHILIKKTLNETLKLAKSQNVSLLLPYLHKMSKLFNEKGSSQYNAKS